MLEESKYIHKIAGVGILTALVVVLQFINNNLPIGMLPFNLAIFPIALGAIMYGPIVGLALGLVDGGMIIMATGTELFMAYNPIATILLCLMKTGLAGLASGFIMMPFRKKNEFLGTILASCAVPIINTGLFILGTFFVFGGAFGHSINGEYFIFILTGIIGVNFFIEFGVNSALSPALYQVYKVVSKRMNQIDNQ